MNEQMIVEMPKKAKWNKRYKRFMVELNNGWVIEWIHDMNEMTWNGIQPNEMTWNEAKRKERNDMKRNEVNKTIGKEWNEFNKPN